MSYRRGNIPDGADPLLLKDFILRELEAIENAKVFEEVLYKKLYAEPSRISEGLVVLADGTAWNPGSGAGFYGYYGGSWHKLG